jgi:hypothetical protein
MLPTPRDNDQKGFCWGEYKATVAEEQRLRLNKPIIDEFRRHKVRNPWLFLGACPSKHFE